MSLWPRDLDFPLSYLPATVSPSSSAWPGRLSLADKRGPKHPGVPLMAARASLVQPP